VLIEEFDNKEERIVRNKVRTVTISSNLNWTSKRIYIPLTLEIPGARSSSNEL
jgi:hypothetical protein